MKRQKNLYIGILFITLSAVIVSSRQEIDEPCKNERYTTAEPGTCIDPKAYRLLLMIDRMQKNPYNNEFAKRLIDFMEPRVKRSIDTLVNSPEADIPVRIYYPTKKSLETATPVIYYIHGGGFTIGSIEEYDMAIKKLAKITGNIVVALDYRLAPEHPWPAAVNDVSAVYGWIIANIKQIGGKGRKITVIGDSAGGNLAAVLALKSRDEGKDNILCQILYYPTTTFRETEFPSRLYFFRDERRSYLLTEEFARESKASYMPAGTDECHPYLSPLEADPGGKLPPLLMLNAQVDPLRDEGRLYAEKIRSEGSRAVYIEYPGIIHGFFNLYMIFPESIDSMKKIREFIEENL